MCQCEDLTVSRKSFLTSRVDSLYDNEVDSDVTFLVGFEPEVWRFPGHKKILSKANPVFSALFEGPLASNEKTIVVEDVEGRAFDYLLRYLYGEEVTFQSTSTALSTLYAAHKYLCSGLIELCVGYLADNLNARNVIEIYRHARLYAVRDNKKEFEPSAPEVSSDVRDLRTPTHCYSPDLINNNSISSNNNNNNNNTTTSRNSGNVFQMDGLRCIQSHPIPFWSDVLVKSCLRYIDDNTDQVLSQEHIEDLSAEDLKEIVKRDSLKISSEYMIFLALDRWANRECKRRKLSLSSKNRRLVLGDLIYEIRFPFFTLEEFISGPIQSGLLNQQELTTFSGLISKSKSGSYVSQKWKSHMDKACRKRSYNEKERATPSQRTYLIEPDKGRDLPRHYLFKKIKNKNGKMGKQSSSSSSSSKGFKGGAEESEKSCTKCFPECLIDILVCLFD